VLTTSGTYPWSCVPQIFHNGKPSHGGDRKTLPNNNYADTQQIERLFLVLI
jgi:hypothetical protein